jgi:hypothetical protein
LPRIACTYMEKMELEEQLRPSTCVVEMLK